MASDNRICERAAMTLQDVLNIISTVPDDWEIWSGDQRLGRRGGQLIFGAHFKTVIEYTGYDYQDYHLPPHHAIEVAVCAIPPGFNKSVEWK